jgi:hypothetical protein
MNLPDFQKLRVGNPDCPSDLALDRFHAKELAPDATVRIEQHAATCETCQARVAERTAGFDAIPGVDPRRILAQIRTRAAEPERVSVLAWARRLLAPTLAVAGMAAVLVMARPHHPVGNDGSSNSVPLATRSKGAAALHVYRLSGEKSVATISGDHFSPGDRLRFSVDLQSDSVVQIVGVEASGTLYSAFPMDGSTPPVLKTGTTELPGAVALDETVGRESLYLVACPPAVGAPQCTSAGPGQKPNCPDSCTLTPFMMVKGP